MLNYTGFYKDSRYGTISIGHAFTGILCVQLRDDELLFVSFPTFSSFVYGAGLQVSVELSMHSAISPLLSFCNANQCWTYRSELNMKLKDSISTCMIIYKVSSSNKCHAKNNSSFIGL